MIIFLNSSESISYWTYFNDTITLVVSLLTLLVAFNIFKRFSFKNHVLEKQFETVSDLINVLQNFTVVIEAKGLTKGEDYFNRAWRVKFFEFKKLKKNKRHKELFFDEKLLFTYDWFENHPLNGLDNNPFMPKEIAKKILPFKIWLPTKADSSRYDKIIRIRLDNGNYINQPDSNVPNFEKLQSFTFDGIYSNEKCFTNFETFYTMCKELIEEIEKWLKKYNAGNLNLK